MGASRADVSRIVEVIAPARLGPSFRWLLSSSWISNLGDGLALAAGPLLVASQTRDPFLVALAVVLQRLPWLLFGLLAGVVADRFDRRRIIVAVQLARALVVGVLTAAILLGQVNTAVVLLAMFLLGTAETFVDITGTTLLPMIVDKRDLAISNSRLLAGTITINQLAGPPVGAALFAAHAAAPFLVQVGCLVVSTMAVAHVVLPAHGVDRAARSHVRRDIAEGVQWLWKNAAVRTLVITIVTFNVTYGAAWSVLVLYAIERLRTGEVGFGLLTTALALGGVLGTAIYGRLTSRVSLGNIMRAGLIIETLTHLALALTTIPWVALVIMFVFGAHAFVWNTTSTTVRQRVVPPGLQGRVSSVYLIGVHGGIVAGSVIGGVIAGAWGVLAPFWFAFVGSAVLVALIWRQLTHIAHADSEIPAGAVQSGVSLATRADIDSWLEIVREVEPLFGPMPNFGGTLERAIDEGGAWCVKDEAGRVLGGMLLGRPERSAIDWLAVRSTARRGGVGRLLVSHALEVFSDSTEIRVDTFGEDNPEGRAARSLYERFGFEPAESLDRGPEGGTRQRFRRRLVH